MVTGDQHEITQLLQRAGSTRSILDLEPEQPEPPEAA
jgi:hypothetical protein